MRPGDGHEALPHTYLRLVPSTTVYAVVSGRVEAPLVRPPGRPRLAGVARTAYARVQQAFAVALPFPIDARADTWTVLVSQPIHALTVAVLMRAWVRHLSAFDVHAAVGVGAIEAVLPDGVGEGVGEAFAAASTALHSRHNHGFAARPPDAYAGTTYAHLYAAVADVAGLVSSAWTPAQAHAAALTLAGPFRARTQREVGALWTPRPISQSAVSAHHVRGRWPLLRSTLLRFGVATRRIEQGRGRAGGSDAP